MSHSPTVAEQYERIPTVIFPTSLEACQDLAREVRDLIKQNEAERPNKRTVLGLATGSTPVPFYRELRQMVQRGELSFQNVVTFNLDEYYGLPKSHPESYWKFMHDQLFDHIDIPKENINLPDGTVSLHDVFAHCEDYERKIEELGGIDLQILGIGRTGHIGFNEPGSSKDSRTRLIALDSKTRLDAASDFSGEENVPRFAITMGVRTILRARKVRLLAWGENKADIVREAVEGPESTNVSASFLQSHQDAKFIVNPAAASKLTRIKLPWLVGPVEWGEREKRRAVTWLSLKLGKPILKLVNEQYNEHGMAELVPGHDGAYRLNIDIFNKQQHTITGWPGGKPGEGAGSNRPVKSDPEKKKVLVFSPEPQDDVISLGSTMERLVEQGHEVVVIYQTTGDLRVTDMEAVRFARVLQDLATQYPDGWNEQVEYAESILRQIEEKGSFGIPQQPLRKLKSLIRRGEARDAAQSLRVCRTEFLDLPFYSKGRYRNFELTDEDIAAVGRVLDSHQPNLIFATGNLADPSSVQGTAWRALRLAMEARVKEAWFKKCGVWLYRGHQKEFEPHEIDMAVPLSPDQLQRKLNAIRMFHSHNLPELFSGEQNRKTAELYDALGMAEYEAIEAFQRYEFC